MTLETHPSRWLPRDIFAKVASHLDSVCPELRNSGSCSVEASVDEYDSMMMQSMCMVG